MDRVDEIQKAARQIFFRTSYGEQFDQRRWELQGGRRPGSAPGWRELGGEDLTPEPRPSNAIHPTADEIMHQDTLISKQELEPNYNKFEPGQVKALLPLQAPHPWQGWHG